MAEERWSRTFDFTRDDGGWFPMPLFWGGNGAYVPNVGWVSTCDGGLDKYQQLVLKKTFPPTIIEDIAVNYSKTLGPLRSEIDGFFYNDLGVALKTTTATLNTGGIYTWSGSATLTEIDLLLIAGIALSGNCPVAGQVIVTSITIYGMGNNPFLKQEGPDECGCSGTYESIDRLIAGTCLKRGTIWGGLFRSWQESFSKLKSSNQIGLDITTRTGVL